MLNIDLNEVLFDALKQGNREPDGMLHPSGDIIGPLRHTMLRMAGAPEKPDTIASMIRLQTGTMWHKFIGDMLESRGFPVMREISATNGLPDGWAGTADLLFWSAEDGGFVLCDIKTTKAAGLPYIQRDGAKPEHVAQLSAYWHAFSALGYPMVNRAVIWYVPMDEDYSVEGGVQPVVYEVSQITDGGTLWTQMEERRLDVNNYLNSVAYPGERLPTTLAGYVTDYLAPPMPRQQKLFKDRDKWNLTLMPHWTAMFCPYSDDLCNCGGDEGDPKSTKIGHFEAVNGEWFYTPRAGYEDYTPELMPKVKVPNG